MPALTFNSESQSFFRRFVAAIGVALVLVLGSAAVSPLLHEHLHDDASATSDTPHACAVVLFASGVTFALAASAVTAPRTTERERAVPQTTEIFRITPRYLHQPERGPPAC